ncbi:right-handed parallel beta-helix repeat-containing protein [Miltoncostaea oceani]|uniref:right-handed parallel beta-helix repeat-containing protein n=1 Tax=Miltoncostaea oceani TaxID=2843216 RepID=UPI001C3E2046|nr:right-handed parallel beta-helix repeat-containing protein [Miltoncostaea oceani]
MNPLRVPSRLRPPFSGRSSRRLIIALLLAAIAAPVVPVADDGTALAAGACTKFASTAGLDTNAGTEAQPYRTAQKLVDNLSPGAVGCLAAGQEFIENVRFNNGGTQAAPITLQSAPGATRATIRGQVFVPDSSNDVEIENLILNGNRAGSTYRTNPTINGDRVVLRGNDISNDNVDKICVHIGDAEFGEALDVTVTQNRIHNCGLLSPRSNLDHGVYVNWAQRTVISDNFFYDNATYGVHLYPRALTTSVFRNVIHGNGKGVIFSGTDGVASNDNAVFDNIITGSLNAPNIESWYPAGNPVGTGNLAERNCLMRDGGATNIGPQVGFTASDNLIVDPQYANAAAKDFTVPAGNPCFSKQPIPYFVGNSPPVVGPFILESDPRASSVLNFRSGALDADGMIMLVEWDFNNDGVWEEPKSSKVVWTFPEAGSYPVKVRATDDDGAITYGETTIVVGAQIPETPAPPNQAPVSDFTYSFSNSIHGGLALTVVSTSTDADGTIAERAWAWGSGTQPSDWYKFGTTHGGAVSPGWMMMSHRTTDNDGARTYARKMIFVPAVLPAPPPSSPPNLVVNPSFETDLAGWGTWQASLTRVNLGAGAPAGSHVVKATRTTGTSFTIDDTNPTVASASTGVTYFASAKIAAANSTSVGKTSRIYLRERDASGAVLRTLNGPALTLSTSFQTATAEITPLSAGNKIEIYINQASAASGDAIYLDDITLTAGS